MYQLNQDSHTNQRLRFRNLGSTSNALWKVLNDIKKNKPNVDYFRLIIADMSKAFDTVNRSWIISGLAKIQPQ